MVYGTKPKFEQNTNNNNNNINLFKKNWANNLFTGNILKIQIMQCKILIL